MVVEHTREAYNFVDLLGDLGGVFDVIVFIASFFTVAISEQTFILKYLEMMYYAKTKDKTLF